MRVRRPAVSCLVSLFVSGPTGSLSPFTLPETGTYTVVVDPRLAQVGSLTFLLADAGRAGGATEAPATPRCCSRRLSKRRAGRRHRGRGGGDHAPDHHGAQLLANDRPGPANEAGRR